jgi:hypothetical protein
MHRSSRLSKGISSIVHDVHLPHVPLPHMPHFHMPHFHMPHFHMPHASFHVPHPHLPHLGHRSHEEGRKHVGLHFKGQFMRMRHVLHHKIATSERHKAETALEAAIIASMSPAPEKEGGGSPRRRRASDVGLASLELEPLPERPEADIISQQAAASLSPRQSSDGSPVLSPQERSPRADDTPKVTRLPTGVIKVEGSGTGHTDAPQLVIRLTKFDKIGGTLFALCTLFAVLLAIFWQPVTLAAALEPSPTPPAPAAAPPTPPQPQPTRALAPRSRPAVHRRPNGTTCTRPSSRATA